MSVEQREIHMKLDALVTAVDKLATKVAFGNNDYHREIIAPFRQAIDEVERMKFDSMTDHLGGEVLLRKEDAPDEDVVHLKEIEEFIRRHGRKILDHQDDHGLKIREDERQVRRYTIYLGCFHPNANPIAVSWAMNPRLKLQFNFDYYAEDRFYQMVEHIKLVAEGGAVSNPYLTTVIPDKLIRRSTWKTIVRHALNAIDCHEVMDELETCFPQETPHEFTRA